MKAKVPLPVLGQALTEEEAAQLASGFKALADPARLRLLSLIADCEDKCVCACELVDPLGRSQPTLSHHLKVLHEAGLLDRERRGTWIYYTLRTDAVQRLKRALSL